MMRSIVEYCAEHEGYKCGYCGGSDSNYSHGMWAHSMTVNDYQELMDRGWRRSGKYCYKPTMDIICCPMYTIRCRALEFKASKSQKKILKRFNKYLSGEDNEPSGERKMSTSSEGNQETGDGGDQFVESTIKPQHINIGDVFTTETIGDSEEVSSGKPELQVQKKSDESIIPTVKKESTMDPQKAPSKKAKLLRRDRKLEKLKARGIDVSTMTVNNKNKEKQLEDFINELHEEFRNHLEIRLVRTNPPSTEYLATAAETHRVYVKYQTTVHNDKLEKCTEPKFQEFLLHSPLLEEHPAAGSGPPCGYGSFHQQYWVRGRLAAVGVLDILPKCVSSVYFFYDPHYMNLTLGTYGALREIELTRELHRQSPQLQYYYMGYYVHTCKKMRYKGNFHPSDLLCPETYKWFPIAESLKKIELSPYSRLDSDLDTVDENYPKQNDINYIPCWVKGNIMHYKLYKRKSNKKTDDEEVVKYSQLVGAKTLQNMILVRPRIK